MPIHGNKGELTDLQKLDYLVTWFREFSEMQKGDFLETLSCKYNEQIEVGNGSLTNGFERISLSGRTSIFSCRIKLFNKWFEEWNPDLRQLMLERFRHLDPDFMQKYDQSVQSGRLPQSSLFYSSYEISDEQYDRLRLANHSFGSHNGSINGSTHTGSPLPVDISTANGLVSPISQQTEVDTTKHMNGHTDHGADALLNGVESHSESDDSDELNRPTSPLYEVHSHSTDSALPPEVPTVGV
jgi:hypothetical protein